MYARILSATQQALRLNFIIGCRSETKLLKYQLLLFCSFQVLNTYLFSYPPENLFHFPPYFSCPQLLLQENITVIGHYLIKNIKLFHYLHQMIEFLLPEQQDSL